MSFIAKANPILVEILSQYKHISNQHIVHSEYIAILAVNYILVKESQFICHKFLWIPLIWLALLIWLCLS